MPSDRKLVSIVAPFYNESEGVEAYYTVLSGVCAGLPGYDFEFVCVDDGSVDDTLPRLLALTERDSRFRVVELSRNFGKEAALTAAVDVATGHAVIPIDADLQDPAELIPLLLQEWENGADVVLARRSDRSSDSFLKRASANMFYRLNAKLSDVPIPNNVGDFRLMNRAVVDALKLFPERQRFMKGIFAWVGFRTAVVEYARQPRVSGSTKFSGWKLWNFAMEGITSFSSIPLKAWTYIGSVCALITFSYAVFVVTKTLIYGIDVPGYASVLVSVLFFGSLQLISIGLLGEYVGRIYMETKQRPIYLIRKSYGKTDAP